MCPSEFGRCEESQLPVVPRQMVAVLLWGSAVVVLSGVLESLEVHVGTLALEEAHAVPRHIVDLDRRNVEARCARSDTDEALGDRLLAMSQFGYDCSMSMGKS